MLNYNKANAAREARKKGLQEQTCRMGADSRGLRKIGKSHLQRHQNLQSQEDLCSWAVHAGQTNLCHQSTTVSTIPFHTAREPSYLINQLCTYRAQPQPLDDQMVLLTPVDDEEEVIVCVCVYVCVWMCGFMCLCVCVCVCVCVCRCMFISLFALYVSEEVNVHQGSHFFRSW